MTTRSRPRAPAAHAIGRAAAPPHHRRALTIERGVMTALASVLLACGAPTPGTTARDSPSPRPPAAATRPTGVTARDAAVAEVARLRALADQDPLLAPWTGPHGGVPPFDRLDVHRFPPALALGIALRQAEVDAIAADPAAPTFANTIAPLEDAGRHLSRAGMGALYDVITNSIVTAEAEAFEREWGPRLAAAGDRILFDPRLFARIAAVHAARNSARLTPEQKRLVEHIHDRFVRAGARLSPAEKEKLGRMNQELAALFGDFSKKLLADESTWIALEKPADLAGLPESLRAAYRAAAEERQLPGKWALVNTRSSVEPFLTFSARRQLREKVWKAFKARGDHGDANDTSETVARIVTLRAERAALLGFASHAHWRMADTMARDPSKAQELMMRVWPAAVARVREEVAEMQAIAGKERAGIAIEPWDYLYYAEKVRRARYALDQNRLKPYFALENIIAAAFWTAEQLYGLRFTEITGRVPVFHPDVRVWEVADRASGAVLGVFYGDYFARPGKESGAWLDHYRRHDSFSGTTYTPLVATTLNVMKGAPGRPVLLSLGDAQTLFREFGRVLPELLSEVRYPSLAEPPRDFAQYLSQLYEMWLLSRPVLDRFARHVDTGQPMPPSLVAKIEAQARFNQGYATVEYLSSAILDMELHSKPDGLADPDAFERETLERIGAPREVAMRQRLAHFSHVFSGDDYSAGYYSYLWSAVMDADTREAILQAGDLFDRATADTMRRLLLASGNTTDRAEAYRQLRGRDPDIEALLRRRGFPSR